MIRLNIVVEGQTEEAFVNELLQEHLQRLDIYATPILLRTSKTGRGGVTTFAKIENQVSRLCKEDTGAYVTTMLDYYGLQKTFLLFSARIRGMPTGPSIDWRLIFMTGLASGSALFRALFSMSSKHCCLRMLMALRFWKRTAQIWLLTCHRK